MNKCSEKVVELLHLCLDFRSEGEEVHARAMLNGAINILRDGWVAKEQGWDEEYVDGLLNRLAHVEPVVGSESEGLMEIFLDAVYLVGERLDPNFGAAQNAR